MTRGRYKTPKKTQKKRKKQSRIIWYTDGNFVQFVCVTHAYS